MAEIHFVFLDSMPDENTRNLEDFDEIEIGRIMEKEASKPLLIVRSW